MIKATAALDPRSGPLVMLYRINAGTVPAGSWIQQEEGGGRIVGEVCHFVDALTFLAGSLPVEVHAIAARDHSDAVSVLIRFADGSTGTIVYSSLGDSSVAKEYVEIFAAGRVIQLDDFRKLMVTIQGKTVTTKITQDKGQQALVKAFFETIQHAREAPIAFDQLFAVTAATFEIENALRQGASTSVAVNDIV
jgi:polar amino acid transport system substrate-binding protein